MVTEFGFVAAVMAGLGFIRAPKWLRHRKLAKGFPWGYYPDKVPRRDPGFANNGNNRDFLHDTGTEFGGMEGFGDYGEFSGFGELGEYGEQLFLRRHRWLLTGRVS